jgi:hypothetical protein
MCGRFNHSGGQLLPGTGTGTRASTGDAAMSGRIDDSCGELLSGAQDTKRLAEADARF